MNKIGLLLDELHDAETGLARHYRRVAGREAVEQDVYYLCHTLAEQCDSRAAWIRDVAARFGEEIREPGPHPSAERAMGTLRRKAAEMVGRRPESGLLLLRDLRALYARAEAVNVHWIMLGQVAQAVRDQELLSRTSDLHKQCLTQIKWLKTRIKEASPQVLVAGR